MWMKITRYILMFKHSFRSQYHRFYRLIDLKRIWSSLAVEELTGIQDKRSEINLLDSTETSHNCQAKNTETLAQCWVNVEQMMGQHWVNVLPYCEVTYRGNAI